MPGEILVPMGGTAESVVALPTALTLAQALDAGLHLVCVLQAPSGPLPGTANVLGAGQAAAAVRSRVDWTLTRVADEVKAAGLQSRSSVLEGGEVAGLLLGQARERDTRMVVMASRPRSAMERSLLGSVADRLIRKAETPVVVVPVRNHPEHHALAHATELGSGLVGAALRAARPVRRILIPIDDSPHALRALNALGPIARAAEEVILLHVLVPAILTRIVEPSAADDRSSLSSLGRYMREACDRLEGIAEQLRVSIPAVRRVVVAADDAAAAITAAARSRGVDLIAMSTRGEGGLKRAVAGSTASQVLRNAAIRVLLVARR
jgi:nucleotide-binding universal stress UspA family protein